MLILAADQGGVRDRGDPERAPPKAHNAGASGTPRQSLAPATLGRLARCVIPLAIAAFEWVGRLPQEESQ